LFFCPVTPKAKESLLFSVLQKDMLLKKTKSPRLVLIGGSNVSFGFNSAVLKDSLKLNPINLGIQGSIGLKFLLQWSEPHIKKGDVVVLPLEYDHFFKSYESAGENLLRLMADTKMGSWKNLSINQWLEVIPEIPKYALSKLDVTQYRNYKTSPNNPYSVKAFNAYGDAVTHWNLDNRSFNTSPIEGKYEPNVISALLQFEKKIEAKGAKMFVSFSALHKTVYENSRDKVDQVQKAYELANFKIIGTADSYVFEHHLFFDGVYHLNKQGLEIRTKQFIGDYKRRQQ
jgi:hypothetical protein